MNGGDVDVLLQSLQLADDEGAVGPRASQRDEELVASLLGRELAANLDFVAESRRLTAKKRVRSSRFDGEMEEDVPVEVSVLVSPLGDVGLRSSRGKGRGKEVSDGKSSKTAVVRLA